MAEGHCKSSYPAYVVLNFMPVPISKWPAGCLQLLACRTVDATLKEPTMLLQRTCNPARVVLQQALSQAPPRSAVRQMNICSIPRHIAARSTGFRVFEPSPRPLSPCSWFGDSDKGPCRRRNWAKCHLDLASRCCAVGQAVCPGQKSPHHGHVRGSPVYHTPVSTVRHQRTSMKCWCMACQWIERCSLQEATVDC